MKVWLWKRPPLSGNQQPRRNTSICHWVWERDRYFFFCSPGHARSSVWWVKVKSAVCYSVSAGPQSFLWASIILGHVWHLKASKVGQDYRMWLGVWGPVPHGHSSEWEIFSLWRWERSWQCPLLSLKIVTWATLFSWCMLSSSVPMYRRCCHSIWSCFLGWSLLCGQILIPSFCTSIQCI